jgi:hypothetical protein
MPVVRFWLSSYSRIYILSCLLYVLPILFFLLNLVSLTAGYLLHGAANCLHLHTHTHKHLIPAQDYVVPCALG